ncbi:MAG: response regulator [Vulcanimicrobiota bacterium]
MNQTARILLLEDDQELRQTLVDVLELEGYFVVAVDRGEQAVAAAHGEAFDLIVADVRMEGMDGIDALRQMRADLPDSRAMVISGYSSEADSIRAIQAGVEDYLKKPFSAKQFLDAVRRLLVLHSQAKERRQVEQRLRRNLLWALKSLAFTIERTQGGEVSQSLQRAQRLALAGGLSPEAAEGVQVALLVHTIGSHSVEGTSPDLPPGITRILEHLEEWWDGSGEPNGLAGSDIPLEARVAALALAGSDPEEEYPGRFDPHLLEALRNLDKADTVLPTLEASVRRSLLSLGRTLAQAGNTGSAREAYHRLLQDPAPTRERVQALLGLARLERLDGRLETASQLAWEATSQAEQVGPVVAATVSLEGGLMLLDSDRASDKIRQAGRLFRQMGDASGQARATLALASRQVAVAPEAVQEALSTLLAPANYPLLVGSVDWLLPFLLEHPQASPELERALQTLARDAGNHLVAVVAAGQLSAAGRLRAVELMGGQPDASPQAIGLPMLRILSMGPFEVYRGDDRIADRAWKTRNVKFLLAALAFQGGRPVVEDHLLDWFWPRLDVHKARKNLYWSTSVLRRTLKPPDWDGDEDYMTRSSAGLGLNPELPWSHDYQELEALVEDSARPDGERFRRLSELYRGVYLEGCYMDWVLPLREKLQRRVADAMAGFVERAEENNQPKEVLEYAHRLVEIDPCRQAAYLSAMQASLALGRPEEAVRQYKSCQKALREQLDMEPDIALVEAHQRALLSID